MSRQPKPVRQDRTSVDGPIEARSLPHDLDAERAILGAILVHDDVLDRAADLLAQGDFFRDAHGRIFAAMLRVAEGKKPVEMLALKDELLRMGELDEVGGPVYLAALPDGNMGRATNVEHYAAIVLEKSRLRTAIFTANKLAAQAYDGEERSSEIAADAAEKLYDLGNQGADGEPVSLASLIGPGVESIEKAAALGTGAVTGLATGFTRLDDLTAGLQNSDLILVAARTSIGKTALAMDIVRALAATSVVAVFSLEMSSLQLFMRMLSAEARVDSHKLRVPSFLNDGDWTRIAGSLDTLAGLKVFVYDKAGIGVREVRTRSRQIRAKHGLAAIFVDYIQLVQGRGKFENRTQEIGSISRGPKSVAKELQVPVVALAQLDRQAEGVYGKKGRRPQLSDLAESGSLENDADVVILIYRPEGKAEDEGDPPAEIIVRKQRNGPTGTVKLAWNREFVRFENLRMV